MIAKRVEDLRAWRHTYDFKLAVYGLVSRGIAAGDRELARQLRESAASSVSQLEEGFARFYPKDFGRMAVGAKASLVECCGHLRDAVDRRLIDAAACEAARRLAAAARKELIPLIDYLQSEEAEENARRIRERRIERRTVRKSAR